MNNLVPNIPLYRVGGHMPPGGRIADPPTWIDLFLCWRVRVHASDNQPRPVSVIRPRREPSLDLPFSVTKFQCHLISVPCHDSLNHGHGQNHVTAWLCQHGTYEAPWKTRSLVSLWSLVSGHGRWSWSWSAMQVPPFLCLRTYRAFVPATLSRLQKVAKNSLFLLNCALYY